MNEIAHSLSSERCPSRLMQEGESAKAYAAFQAYFEMGDARSLPAVVKTWDGSRNSLYKWAKQFRWDERIDAATAEVLAIYRRETEKQAIRFAARNARKRQEIADREFEIIEIFHAKAKEVIQFMVVKDVTTSKDGKTIIIKSNPNIRLADAVRLLLGGNVAMNQIHEVFHPRVAGRSGAKAEDSRPPSPSKDMPVMEIWLDGGDGAPLPFSQMPPVDKLDPDFHPDLEDDEQENASPPNPSPA